MQTLGITRAGGPTLSYLSVFRTGGSYGHRWAPMAPTLHSDSDADTDAGTHVDTDCSIGTRRQF